MRESQAACASDCMVGLRYWRCDDLMMMDRGDRCSISGGVSSVLASVAGCLVATG